MRTAAIFIMVLVLSSSAFAETTQILSCVDEAKVAIQEKDFSTALKMLDQAQFLVGQTMKMQIAVATITVRPTENFGRYRTKMQVCEE